MLIAKDTVVSLTYQLTGTDGKVIERTEEPISYLHGGYEGIFPLVEQALEGKEQGFSCEVRLEPDDAFGDYDAELVRVEARKLFPPKLQVGMQFEGIPESSDDDDTLIYRVTEIADDKVVLDGNHPLAGMALVFTCTVTAVRPASAEEIAHGHIHDGEHEHEH